MPWDVFSTLDHGGHQSTNAQTSFSLVRMLPRPQEDRLSLLCSNLRVPMTRRWKSQLLPYLTRALSNPSILLSSGTSSSTANYTLDFQTNLSSPAGTSASACTFSWKCRPSPVSLSEPWPSHGNLARGTIGIVGSFHNTNSPEAKNHRASPAKT